MRRSVPWLAMLLLAGCQLSPPPATIGDAEPATVAAFPRAAYDRAAEAGRPVYDLLPEASSLRLFVYRAGALARYGHNHVISATDWQGALVFDGQKPADSRLDLHVPVRGLEVDPPALRRQLGGGFDSELDGEAVADTTANMLSADILDAQAHPVIAVQLQDVQGALPRPILTLAATAAGRRASITVPVAVSREPERLIVEGRAVIRHEDLGLTPFSAAGGALRVAQPVMVSFRMVGERRRPGEDSD